MALVRAEENRLILYGTTDDAVEVAVNHALSLLDEGGDIPLDTDVTLIFNALDYRTDKTLTGYTMTDLKNLSEASAITVGGKALPGFEPNVTSYTVSAIYKDGYPTVKVTPLWKESVVSITPATAENGGVATVRITSASGNGVSVYTVKVNMNNYYEVDAEVVNRGGKEATLTYVIDDGDEQTSENAIGLLTGYPNVKLTFALKTVALATLKVNSAGTEYVMKDGKYTYDKLPLADTWKTRLENKNIEVVSHTYSHAFHGTNDDGGTFRYVKNNETTAITSGSFPKGSSTKEILASKQILEELFGIESVTLIHAGIGVRTSDYTLSDGTVISTYKKYFNEVLGQAIEDGKIIGTRGTFTVTDKNQLASKVNFPKTVYDRRLTGIFAFMVEDYDDETLWSAYIDEARKAGGWACFCIHNIRDNQSGKHHIKVAQADRLFKIANDLADEVALMNFTEATKYYQEWYSAKITATAYKEESIKLTVTDTLDNTLFNEPLTVKVNVPDSWSGAYYTVGTNTVDLTVRTDSDGVKYILVDTVPDSAAITVFKK